MAYMPFGEGPRHCIGKKISIHSTRFIFVFVFYPYRLFIFINLTAQRMGVMNVKVAIVQVLKHFRIHVKPEIEEMEIGNFGIPILPKKGVFIKLSRKISNQN